MRMRVFGPRVRAGLVILGLASVAAVPPALADQAAADMTRSSLEAGTLAGGDMALSAMVDKDGSNQEARAGLGVVRFVKTVEHLSQGLYKYGLEPPQSFLVPIVRLPVPDNPNPQPITYQDFRGLLQSFVDDLSSAEATLGGVGGDDVALVIDLRKVRYDADGDGKADDEERFVSVIERVTGYPEADMPASLEFRFDKGDILWLQGYCNVLIAFGDFFLAYDWHESFDDAFFHFFPSMHSPFRDALAKPTGNDEWLYTEAGPVADFISFFHIRWPVADATRLLAARDHLKKVVTLSRASWDAIEKETDNDREWIPNERQTSRFEGFTVDAQRIAAWRSVLDEADAVLDGNKLVPYWRFDKGINLRKVFEQPQPFDAILWVTGPAALPYLEDGPITTSDDWAKMQDAFNGSFGVFAIWFN